MKVVVCGTAGADTGIPEICATAIGVGLYCSPI